MENLDGFVTTPRDRVLRAWQNSTELVRDYRQYSHELDEREGKLSRMFAEFAEDEAAHAAKLLVLLRGYDGERKGPAAASKEVQNR